MTNLFSKSGWLLSGSLFIALVLSTLPACQPPALESNVRLECMQNTHVHFSPGANWDSLSAIDGWQRRDNGRVLTQSFAVPLYSVRPTVTAEITLRSAGDPWDKSGSLMLLPEGTSNLLDVGFTADTLEEFPGIALRQKGSSTDYAPAIELLRFITPFGVGHFSQVQRLNEYRPVYIPRWEDSVHWKADISHLWEALGDTMTLGVYLDTWTSEGYTLDVEVRFEANPATVVPAPSRRTIALVNTSKFGSEQHPYDAFSRSALTVPINLNETAYNAVLHYTATGHGGHGEGDEFVPCEHQLTWDGDSCLTFTPWRDDCASFRRFNPSSGVWMDRTLWRGDSLDERIASSDLSRSGWCPGSQVDPVRIPLGDLSSGVHELSIAIPTAQPFSDSEMNFWNIAAYLTYEAH